MSRWYLGMDTQARASNALRMGIFGAVGMAAWFGIPMFVLVPRMRAGLISPVEIALVAVIVGLALFGAWRFYIGLGRIVGPILMIALVVEVAKRLYLTFDGVVSISPVSWAAAALIFGGLLNGVRGARALLHLTPDESLKDVFE
jgi:hypothetical protein